MRIPTLALTLLIAVCLIVEVDTQGVRLRCSSACGTVDATNPVLVFTAPNGGSSPHNNGSTTPLTTLAGTCTDNIAVSQVTWSNDRGGSGTATFSAPNWSIASADLQSGSNVFTLTCSDAAGNSDSTGNTFTVTYTPSGGSATLLASIDFEDAACSGDTSNGSANTTDATMCGTNDDWRFWEGQVAGTSGVYSTIPQSSTECDAHGATGGCFKKAFTEGANQHSSGLTWETDSPDTNNVGVFAAVRIKIDPNLLWKTGNTPSATYMGGPFYWKTIDYAVQGPGTCSYPDCYPRAIAGLVNGGLCVAVVGGGPQTNHSDGCSLDYSDLPAAGNWFCYAMYAEPGPGILMTWIDLEDDGTMTLIQDIVRTYTSNLNYVPRILFMNNQSMPDVDGDPATHVFDQVAYAWMDDAVVTLGIPSTPGCLGDMVL